ncbi:hypothetical protein [Streptomyces sp. NPDC058741]|uniref:hypothetical protein n=1 Tax=Streptomyces sp. NPDC058741 TaxID=3346620 RepID=UPI003699720F
MARDVRRCLESNTEDRIRDEMAFLGSYRRKAVSRHVMSVRAPDVSRTSVSVNNWSQSPLYRIDLGAGRPFWYEFADPPVPRCTSLPHPRRTGAGTCTCACPSPTPP